MKYGIQENENIITCANCGRIISRDGEYKDNYCYNCGNPLKENSIVQREKDIEQIEKNALSKVRATLLKSGLTKDQIEQILG